MLANAKTNSASIVCDSSGGTAIGSWAARSFASTVASDSLSTVPGPQVASTFWIASMHWPKVSPLIATPWVIPTTSVIPGIARSAARLLIERSVPLIVGGLATMVGFAFGICRSIANCLRPVTMSWASTRLRGFPITLNSDGDLSCADTVIVLALAAALASDPYVAVRPFGPLTTPLRVVTRAAPTLHCAAAVSTRRCRAIAAAVRTGRYMLRIEFDPPVSWFISNSGRASARPISTFSIGRSSSSATIIANAVVMPCPTSARGTAKNAVPSVLNSTVIRLDVGAAARFCRSPRSKMSTGCGTDGTAASAGCAPDESRAQLTPTARVGAAIR